MRKPRFDNLKKVFTGKAPGRPTLFELFLNEKLYRDLANIKETDKDNYSEMKLKITAFKNAGYDYATVRGSDFGFQKDDFNTENTRSINEGNMIKDRVTFNNYNWPDPDGFNYSRLEEIQDFLLQNFKLIVIGPGGVLENVIDLVGYESLCYLIMDNPQLVKDICDAVGSRLVRYYEICASYDSVGALISNDDWGFNTQTMLSPSDLRKYIFPWHTKIVDTIHAANKYAILHSCGNLNMVMEDVIENMNYDAKHSFEDNILPVEEAYERWGDRIAILGGIDVNFLCTAKPEQVKQRVRNLIEKTRTNGGYAIGSGNSIPEYIPQKNYYAMIKEAKR